MSSSQDKPAAPEDSGAATEDSGAGSGEAGAGSGECDFNMDFPQEMDGEQWVKHFWEGDFLPWAMELEPDK